MILEHKTQAPNQKKKKKKGNEADCIQFLETQSQFK